VLLLTVFSLSGVVLIARPPFLFGDYNVSLNLPAASDGNLPAVSGELAEKGSSTERMVAVGYATKSS
jgi:hypothetical protein